MSQNRVLEGKLAIVTGASRGIGAAVCENLASKGCSLVMAYTSDNSTKPTEELAARLSSTYSVKTQPVQADIGSKQAPAYIVSMAQSHFAHPRTKQLQIDIIINNAGIGGNEPLGDTSPEKMCEMFDRYYAINVRGPLLLVQACLPHLPHDRSGRIVNLSSISSSLGLERQSLYGGTKAALEGMTRCWATALRDRATVNAVNPGPTATDMYKGNDDKFVSEMGPHNAHTPLAQLRPGIDPPETVKEVTEGGLGGRAAEPAEVAGVIGMLCTPDSLWCTGSVVCANGGMRFSY